ncbi:sugar ABC transporter substrate-binding protein [Streptosporangium sp. NPDC048865]|uniref:ABC transporter substrate-binding protein n=1 Tax=Streptosporangium sp. NPDC048865 TaxID=3155766 RepID=UPI0034252365
MFNPVPPARIRTRRHVAKAAGTTVIALALAACGGSGEPAEGGPTTLTVTVWNLAKTPEFTALFQAFEKANPGVKVKPVDILADDYPEKVTTMLAGGDRTDVITMKNVTDYSRYSSRGQLLDVTDLATSADASKLAGLEAFDIGNTYYALPYRQDFWLLYYNKTLLDKAGIKLTGAMTWDDYAKYAQRLTRDEGGKKVYGAYHHTWRSVIQAISAAQTGGDQLGGDYTFFTDQYTMALGLQKSGAVMDYGTASAQQADYRNMFGTGATAMMPMGTWYVSGILEAKKKGESKVDWALAPMPQRADSGEVVTFGSPTGFAVNKRSRSADLAKKFVQFAAGRAGAEAIAQVGVVPALRDPAITEAYFKLEGMPSDELSKKAFEPGKVVLEMPVSDKSSDVDTILNEEHQLIMVGEKPVADGTRSMSERVKNEVLD